MSFNMPQSAHQALLNLERSSAPPTELFDEAARILGIEFDQIQQNLSTKLEDAPQRSQISFAPKEEWTLRWLLKKTKPAANGASRGSDIESSANDDHRKWLLFYHLVCRTPIKQLAKILRDQGAMRQIRDALFLQVVSQKNSASSSAVSIKQRTTGPQYGDDDYEVPQGLTKKRKRSPGFGDPSGTVSSALEIVLPILKTVQLCLDNALIQNGEDAVAQQHLRIALSLPPGMVAAILGHMLQLVSLLGGDITWVATRTELLHLLQGVLRLWDLRHGPDLGHTTDESNDAFTSHCLLPALHLLESMKHWDCEGQLKELKSQLEKIIAVHAVEPARQIFFRDLVKTWKADQDPLHPEHIKPATDRLQGFICQAGVAKPDSILDRSSILKLTAPVFLEIAIRSSPRSTVIRAQQERPWLEALFVYLAHTVGCSLIDPGEAATSSNEKSHHQISSSHSIREWNPLSSLEKMLGILLQRKASLSLPILSSLVQHFGGLQDDRITQWDLVNQIMQLDINVFLPNAGISGASSNLNQLVNKLNVEASLPPVTDKPLFLNDNIYLDILGKLMEGFGFARDLGTFLNVWMDRLAAIEDFRVLEQSSGRPVSDIYSLWDDEDTLAKFAEVSRKYALSTFLDSFKTKITEGRIEGAPRDEKYYGKYYALTLVYDVICTTHWEEMALLKAPLTLPRVRCQEMLAKGKTSWKLLGWINRLSRHVFLLCGDRCRHTEDTFSGENEEAMIKMAMREARSKPVYFQSMQAFREVELIHTFITMAANARYWETTIVTREISALANWLIELKQQNEVKELAKAQVWDGRANSVNSSVDLITAFLGIFLQDSKVLCLDIDVTLELVKAMAPFITEDHCSRPSQSTVSCLMRAILLDEQLVSSPGFVKKCFKALGFMDLDEISDEGLKFIQSLPKEALSKSQRKKVTEWQLQRRVSQRQTDGLRSKKVSGDFHATQGDLIKSVKDSEMTFGDLERSCGIAREASSLITRDHIASVCESLRKEESLNSAKFLLLGSMLIKDDMISAEDVTRLAANLPALLPKAGTLDTFCLIADCIKILLGKHHSAVNQWTIDNLLACITITLSPQGPCIANSHAASIIFSRLCLLLSTILSRHRIRLGGRYHLLLPALYGLLRCLFAPDDLRSLRTQSQLVFHSKLPPWMRSNHVKLTKSSSMHFTRILTTICNPTPSAVKRPKTHNSLTDQTKKARRIAGEYMQYVIAEYCSCQLQSGGGIEASAKEGLMPGLFAILDVMGREGMRGMNARMDASSRAIWKGLYEDWCRFGRWNGM